MTNAPKKSKSAKAAAKPAATESVPAPNNAAKASAKTTALTAQDPLRGLLHGAHVHRVLGTR